MLTFAALAFASLAGLTAVAAEYRTRAFHRTRTTAPAALLAAAAACAAAHLWHTGPAAGNRSTWALLVLCSAAATVMVTGRQRSRRYATTAYVVIGLMFLGTAAILAPGGAVALKLTALIIAGLAAAVVFTVLGRIRSALDVRGTTLHLDPGAARIVAATTTGQVRVLVIGPDELDADEYRIHEVMHRAEKNFATADHVIFLEVTPARRTAQPELSVHGEDRYGYRVLRTESPTAATAVAAILLQIRDHTGQPPHVYFRWAERSPHLDAVHYLRRGGDLAVVPLTRAKLRDVEPDRTRRPVVHVD